MKKSPRAVILNLVNCHRNAVQNYFDKEGFIIESFGRPGRHEADFLVRESRGNAYPVEEKRWVETCISTSSWWSYWKAPLASDIIGVETLPAKQRGWVAVIAGQLYEWCGQYDTDTGYLAAEFPHLPLGIRDKRTNREHIEAALAFLAEAGIITDWTADSSLSYAFYRIRYAVRTPQTAGFAKRKLI
jgi:hypothetical protein